MAEAKGKNANSVLGKRRRLRRDWLTFMRLVRYGIDNFSRNAWLTTAATAVMLVTLIIIFTSVLASNVFDDTLNDFRQNLKISFYLKDDLTKEQRESLERKLEASELITGVTYVSKEEARKAAAEDGADNPSQLEALSLLGEENPYPASFRIQVSDPSRLSEIDPIFEQKDFKEARSPDVQASTLGGDRREAIDSLASTASFIEKIGLALSIVSVVISTLIIFNTIRMAIFNRRDEIQMMKLIGADKNFIQGPFIIEAVMYGFFAAVATVAISYPIILTKGRDLSNWDINVDPTIRLLQDYPAVALLGLIAIGAVIGIVSSLLAIRRYLKV